MKIIELFEFKLPKNQWVMDISNDSKMEVGGDLVDLVKNAYTAAPLGSMIDDLKDVIPSDWSVIDFDQDPDVDSCIFYRNPRKHENWVGHKIQGIGHDGTKESKEKVIKKLNELLNKDGWFIESSDRLRNVLLKLNAPIVTDHDMLKKLFNDDNLTMVDDYTYTRKLQNGKDIIETVFGKPKLKTINEETINEALSKIVYHYTGVTAALNIMASGNFELTSSLGSVEAQYAPKNKPYFLSTTRTKLGGYHDFIGSTAVMFVMDGDYYNSRYYSKSIDYWENRDPAKSHHRAHEAEDRIFNNKPTIPINGVTNIHVYVNIGSADANMREKARQLLILAKKRNINTYFYTDPRAWKKLDTRKTTDVSVLKGAVKVAKPYHSAHKGYLLPWIEVMFAKEKSQLSKDADKLVYSLNGPAYYKQDIVKGLMNDLSNSRKPGTGIDRGNVVKIIKYMQQNKLNTVAELVNHLTEKWKNK
jgi:hypothetical protein